MTNAFKVIVLGCTGGPKEDNLSGYLVAPFEKDEYICFDAGSLLNGLEKALAKGHLQNLNLEDDKLTPLGLFFRNHIKGYFISHPHLDHTLSLVINSQVDGKKFIGATSFTIRGLKKHLFNGKIWPNFGNEGKHPLNFYQYHHLKLNKKQVVPSTTMTVQPFDLEHDDCCKSTAFLLENQGKYVLYFGDTAPDRGRNKKLGFIWKKIAPLVREKKLAGLFLECSYPKGQGGQGAKYHLDSETFMQELQNLEKACGQSIKGLSCIVTHCKESLYKERPVEKIEEELKAQNHLGLNLIFPKQGDLIVL